MVVDGVSACQRSGRCNAAGCAIRSVPALLAGSCRRPGRASGEGLSRGRLGIQTLTSGLVRKFPYALF